MRRPRPPGTGAAERNGKAALALGAWAFGRIAVAAHGRHERVEARAVRLGDAKACEHRALGPVDTRDVAFPAFDGEPEFLAASEPTRGWLVIAATVANNLVRSGIGAYLSHRAGAGALTLSLSSGAVGAIGCGIRLVVLGWVIAEAADLADERRQIV